MVANELEERAVRIAEVDALPAAARALALDRAELGLDPAPGQERGRFLGGAVEAEAEVAVPRPHRVGGARMRLAPGPVHVQLLLAEAVGMAAVLKLDEL